MHLICDLRSFRAIESIYVIATSRKDAVPNVGCDGSWDAACARNRSLDPHPSIGAVIAGMGLHRYLARWMKLQVSGPVDDA
jgi:hypothetical protein